jgi:DNA-binding SARP family transcriptional activator
LIDDLWGDEVPSSAPKAIQNFVSRLRKLLPPNTIVTRPPGYAVEAGSGQLDLERFGQLLNAGRESLGAGEPRVASELFREALSLWRGPALAEFCPAPFAEREGPRLEELRLEALERWLESELAVGHHSEVVGELESLVGRYPLREGLRRQLMVALYRSHRQAEALSVYQDARRRLVDELGIEPSATLQDLERAILRQDASLALDAGTSAAAAPAQRGEHPLVPADDRSQVRSSREPAAPNRLLRGAETFVGREAETARLQVALRDALDGQGQLVMLVGEPGIGKTRTAAEVAVAAEQLGASAFWGRCRESEGAPPYWPWVEALR